MENDSKIVPSPPCGGGPGHAALSAGRQHGWLRQALVGQRYALLAGTLAMLAEGAISLATPWMAGIFTERLVQPDADGWLSPGQLLAAWLVVLAVQAVLRYANGYALASVGERLLAMFRARIYHQLQALPLGWHQQQRRGDVLTLLTGDAASVSAFITGPGIALLPQLLVLVGAWWMMFSIDARIAVVVMVAMPACYLAMKIAGRRIRPLAHGRVDAWSSMLSLVEENLTLLPVIKSFVRERLESQRFEARNEALRAASLRYQAAQLALSPLVRWLAAAGIVLILWLSLGRIEDGRMAAGELVSLLLYGMLLTAPLSRLADVYGQAQGCRVALGRLARLFHAAVEPSGADGRVIERAAGGVRFEDVRYAYPGRQALLRGVDLELRPGEVVALTGNNGAGKSTLAHLLLRFDDPGGGRIALDGEDIRSFTVASLRRQVALVSQQVLLANASVYDNIAFAVEQADPGAVERAARDAQALSFIRALPQGFDTVIGELGVRLSGGEKQRLALARALLVDAPVLVLDEATAMFDPDGERALVRDLDGVLAGRTVLLITHRPESLAMADRVVQLVDGRIRSRDHGAPDQKGRDM